LQSHYADIHTQYYGLQKGLEGNAMPEIPWWEGKVGIVKWMKGYGKEDITHGVWSLSRYGRVSVNQRGLFRSPLSRSLGG